jgi:membrane associated rhomboid family serine protease
MITTNSNFITQAYCRFFKYGNTAMRYISLNITVFLILGLASLIFSLSTDFSINSSIIEPYLALPSNTDKLIWRFYTFATYPFVHLNLFHILFNMLWLYWMGNLFLDFFSKKQFHLVYWGGAIFGGLAFVLLGKFYGQLSDSTMIGASAAVMAIFTAIALRIPNYAIRFVIFGDVKLKYLIIIYLVLDVLSSGPNSANAGGNFSHLGGALFGFLYVSALNRGVAIENIFKPKPKLKVNKNKFDTKHEPTIKHDQEKIDQILDKISKSGYEGLSADDKRTLFEAGKKS